MTVRFLRFASDLSFVPKHRRLEDTDIEAFLKFLLDKGPPLVVTGAGISTESGIPDYRSEGVGLYSRTQFKPTNHQDFLKFEHSRRRYWARNYIGWPKFSSSTPNSTHLALARLEENGYISSIITQNVDRLHEKAGSKNVIELHGSGYSVICLSCDWRTSRHSFQDELDAANPGFQHSGARINPDGDVALPEDVAQRFVVPPCPSCGGLLKPDIVFFGDNVPSSRVTKVRDKVSESKSIIAFGTSLTVYSSFRIALQASDLGLPILAVNIGPTRADNLLSQRLDVRCGQLLEEVCERLLLNNC